MKSDVKVKKSPGNADSGRNDETNDQADELKSLNSSTKAKESPGSAVSGGRDAEDELSKYAEQCKAAVLATSSDDDDEKEENEDDMEEPKLPDSQSTLQVETGSPASVSCRQKPSPKRRKQMRTKKERDELRRRANSHSPVLDDKDEKKKGKEAREEVKTPEKEAKLPAAGVGATEAYSNDDCDQLGIGSPVS